MSTRKIKGGAPPNFVLRTPERAQKAGPLIQPRDVWGGSAHRIEAYATFLEQTKAGVSFNELEKSAEEIHDRLPGFYPPSGTPVNPGVASGRVVKSVAEANDLRAQGKPYVFLLSSLNAGNIQAALDASAIITEYRRKNSLSAPFVGLGRPVVEVPRAEFEQLELQRVITVDGTTGRIAGGVVEPTAGAIRPETLTMLGSLKKIAGGQVIAEASTPAAVERAAALGATTVRVDADVLLSTDAVLRPLRRFLVETQAAPKQKLLEELIAEIRSSAEALIEAAGGADVTFAVGTRSPKSFFPAQDDLLDAVAEQVGLPAAVLRERVEDLGSGNSKLGLRGGRLGVKFPDLFGGIARAVFEASAAIKDEGVDTGGINLLVPAVSLPGELTQLRTRFETERQAVEADFDVELDVKYGAGIETAAGALNMEGIAKVADFAEYGLSELTETVLGISRDDADSFIPDLVDQGIYPADPFERPAFDLLDKVVMVAQYLAGDTPNSFPASIRGPLALDPNGLLLGRQGGIKDVTVPLDSFVTAHVASARMAHSLAGAVGLQVNQPGAAERDRSSKLIDLLAGPSPSAKGEINGTIPDGVTPLEHIERLIRKVKTKSMTPEDVLLSVDAGIVDSLRRPVIDPKADVKVLAKGAGASPGCGVGRLALSHDKAEEYEKAGIPYVLLVNEVHAEDVPAVRTAEGLISVRGGTTSHSAMIAANSDVPCVMDDKAKIDLEGRKATIGRSTVREGDMVSIDGTKGHIILGEAPLVNPSESKAYETLMKWADKHRTLKVMANADTPDEAVMAFESGAEGVGLVRSEHMFFGENRLIAFRSAILGDGQKADEALTKMEAFQRHDFAGLFKAANGKKVAVRLLDPPLYEFLPNEPDSIRELAKELGLPAEEVVKRIDDAQEVDSLMGLRGARLAAVRPEIEATQVRALAHAFVEARRDGVDPKSLYITVPMINTGTEMKAAAERIKKAVAEVEAQTGETIPLQVGAMIETPASALDAGAIAESSDYRSYGTNDLTQMTLGFGRNGEPKFIPGLIKSGALSSDPSRVLDSDTVGKMMLIAESGAADAVAPQESGICGAQGSDAESVRLVQKLKLTYVSVPPAQVPKARLAAAQAAVLDKRGKLGNADLQIAGPHAEMSPAARAITQKLERAMSGVTQVPFGVEQHGLRDLIDLVMRQARVELRKVVAEGGAAQFEKHDALFDLYAKARTMRDADRLIEDLRGEIAMFPVNNHMDASAASSAVDELAKAATARLSELKSTSGSEREIAKHAWAALRALDSAREVVTDAGVPISTHASKQRLWHRNDGWDNPHYTRSSPDPTKPMGTYLKQVAKEFLTDNAMTTSLVGEEHIPKDDKVVFAVTHRSGAIDRFVVVNALPIGDDDFMYIVREDSPLDVRAKEAYGEDNPWIVPARGLVETSARVKSGFENGSKYLITYPEGTGTIAGEPRYVAAGTALIAMNAGAKIVPVSIHDTFDVEPLRGGDVQVRAMPSIDPSKIAKELGVSVDDPRTLNVVRGLLQYRLGSALPV